MARIAIDSGIWVDPRFRSLSRSLGCEDKALGMLVRFWTVAQVRWGHGELVSTEEFDLGGFDALVTSGFAIKKPNGVYARGSEERFSWYAAICKNSQKAVKAKSLKADQMVDRTVDRTVDQTVDQMVDQMDNPSSSSSSSSSKREERESDKPGLAPNGAPPPLDLVAIWNRARGTLPAARLTPSRRAKVASRLKEEPEADYWTTTIRRLAGSTFATGTNDRGWRADFGWLIANGENHVKVNEGKYDNRTIGLAPAPKQKHRNQPPIFAAIARPEGDEST